MRDESPKDGFLKTKSVVAKWKPTMMTLRRELSFWNSRVAESKLESLLDAVEKVREETMTKNVISMEEKASWFIF